MGRGTNEIIVYLPLLLRFWEAKRWGLENCICMLNNLRFKTE